MSFLSFLFPRRKKSAQLAKQRLQAVISAERARRAGPTTCRRCSAT